MAVGKGTNFWQSFISEDCSNNIFNSIDFGIDIETMDGNANATMPTMTLTPEKPWTLFGEQNVSVYNSYNAWSSSSSDADTTSEHFSGKCSPISPSPERELKEPMASLLTDCYSTLLDFQWDRNFVQRLVGLPVKEERLEAKIFFPEIQNGDILEVMNLSKFELSAFHTLLNHRRSSIAHFSLIQNLKRSFLQEPFPDYYSKLSYSFEQEQDSQLLKSWETTQGLIYQYVSASVGNTRETILDRLKPILENLAKIILQVRLNLYKTLSTYNYEEMELASTGKEGFFSIQAPVNLPVFASDPFFLPENRFPQSRRPKNTGTLCYQVHGKQKESRKSF